MLGWPGSDWGDAPSERPPLDADWRDPGAEVRHTFTHFHLRLQLRIADVDQKARPKRGDFMPKGTFRPADLPTVMRKAYDVGASELRKDAPGTKAPDATK
jgi:A/G-specific adenine glycosylase